MRDVKVDVPEFRANPHQSGMAPESAFEHLMDAGSVVYEETRASRWVMRSARTGKEYVTVREYTSREIDFFNDEPLRRFD